MPQYLAEKSRKGTARLGVNKGTQGIAEGETLVGALRNAVMLGNVDLSSLESSITSNSTPQKLTRTPKEFGNVFKDSGFDADAIIGSKASPKADYIRNKMALLLNQFVKAARKLA